MNRNLLLGMLIGSVVVSLPLNFAIAFDMHTYGAAVFGSLFMIGIIVLLALGSRGDGQ